MLSFETSYAKRSFDYEHRNLFCTKRSFIKKLWTYFVQKYQMQQKKVYIISILLKIKHNLRL